MVSINHLLKAVTWDLHPYPTVAQSCHFEKLTMTQATEQVSFARTSTLEYDFKVPLKEQSGKY